MTVLYSPVEMVFHHSDHGVLDVLLVLAQLGRHLLLELLGEGLDDHVAVSNLLPIELNEGQETFLGPELAFVIHVLKMLPLNVSKYFHLKKNYIDQVGRKGSPMLQVGGVSWLVCSDQ